jgi:hypothetical protein
MDPGAQRSAFRKNTPIKDDVIAIGVAGRIVPVKNLKLFVQVAKDLIAGSHKKALLFYYWRRVFKKTD